ncbi:MAG: hypothetical protein MZV63_18665 [Marinilabiliales bacterium]|nr:hypothetical protein [Marinilabiliales bacterium]
MKSSLRSIKERKKQQARGAESASRTATQREGMIPANMTPEQMRAFMQNLTPEQREAMRQHERCRGPGAAGTRTGQTRRRQD